MPMAYSSTAMYIPKGGEPFVRGCDLYRAGMDGQGLRRRSTPTIGHHRACLVAGGVSSRVLVSVRARARPLTRLSGVVLEPKLRVFRWPSQIELGRAELNRSRTEPRRTEYSFYPELATERAQGNQVTER